MGINIELAKKAEKEAKRICKKAYGSDALWELFLSVAYRNITKRNAKLEPLGASENNNTKEK